MYISIDMGGTRTRVASSDDLKNIKRVNRFYTNKNVLMQKQLCTHSIEDLAGREQVDHVCFGVPGTIDKVNKKFLNFPNYRDLNGKGYSDLLDAKYLKNCSFENDASLGGIGEAFFGAGRDYRSIGYLALGTGVGGCLVTKNSDGTFECLNEEPGHMIILPEGRFNSSCGHNGCLEAYTSGHSFEILFSVKPQHCSDEEIWKKYAEFVNLGLEKLFLKWKCEVFILGGSMALEYSLFSDYLSAEVPVLRTLTLDDAGVYGGLHLMKTILHR